jgi:uncharacterized glyoxalase superfamily protein PhnB
MQPAPPDWPRCSSSLFYDDAKAAIAWLGKAFGLEPRLVIEGDDGGIVHSELTFGEAVVMVSSTGRRDWYKSPRSAGGNTQSLFMYVDDVDAHAARAEAAGATITDRPEVHDYGDDYWADRSYGCTDLEGHHWWFSTRLKTKGK